MICTSTMPLIQRLRNTSPGLYIPEEPMGKCSLKYEGMLRHSDRLNAGITDADLYAILKEEWMKGKNR